MARTIDNDFAGQTDANHENITTIDANSHDNIALPSTEFVADATMTRDGQDLVLNAPNGETIIVQGYFSAEIQPDLNAPDGSILTPNLVQSFLSSPMEYAQASSMSDESPVGAVEEISGAAQVIRADGSAEDISLGTPIYQGDVIETSDNGAVNIIFMDETSMAISEDARLSVDNYKFDAATESGETNLSVLRGVFVFTSGLIGRDDPDDVMIDTPVGSIGIRGTIIAGKIQPGQDSEITVVEGAIVIKNGAMETTLSQQYESVKLGGFNDQMQDLGVKDASDVSKTYGSVSDVVPKLFSSINDNIKESKSDEAQDSAPAEEAVDDATVEASDKEVNAQEDVIEAPSEEVFEALETAEAEAETAKEVKQAAEGGDKRARAIKANIEAKELAQAEEIVAQQLNNPLLNRALNLQQTLQQQEPTVTAQPTALDLNGATNQTSNGASAAAIVEKHDINNDGLADTINPLNDGNVEIKSNGTTKSTVNITSTETNDEFGASFATLGDFDGDGKSDFIVGAPGDDDNDGFVFVHTNSKTESKDFDNEGIRFGNDLDYIGDFNGDGLSDVLIGTGETGRGYIMMGNSAGSIDSLKITLGNTNNIITAGGIGDINGDGFDDFAISLQNNTNSDTIDTYAIFGTSNIPTPHQDGVNFIDMNYLTDPSKALKITHNGLDNPSNYNITQIGDHDGDGFDDFVIGNGQSKFTVFGQATADVVTDGDSANASGNAGDANVNPGEIAADAANQALAGDANFYDNGQSGVRMQGGSSDNTFTLTEDDFKNIEGGAGFDTIINNKSGVLDFQNINFEQISGIEKIEFGSGNAIKLTAENIFNFLKSSDEGEFFVTANTAKALSILKDSDDSSSSTLEQVLEHNSSASDVVAKADKTIDGDAYKHFEIGDYNLYIDTDVTVNVA